MTMFIGTLVLTFLSILTRILARPKILVVGGSGRVGGSAVRALNRKFGNQIDLTVVGRSQKNWISARERLGVGDSCKFLPVDFNTNSPRIRDVIRDHDIIIHTAGPFQRLRDPFLLEYCMSLGKSYLDVCDDIELSRICRSEKFQELAKSNGGSAIISTGIWPGASSLLAEELISRVGDSNNINEVLFSFFTAGSGGAGPTILTATFLLLGENVLTYREGIQTYKKPASNPRLVDFGKDIGFREVVRLNLIECESCATSSKIPYVETFFGTAPPIWNTLFVIMANLIPQQWLQNRDYMANLALISLPMVRLVDTLVGSTNGIRVDIKDHKGVTHTALLTHRDLEKCVGDAIAAFAGQVILNRIPPGVYFPEEVPEFYNGQTSFRKNVLEECSLDAISYQYIINK